MCVMPWSVGRAIVVRFEFEKAFEGQVAKPTAAVTMSEHGLSPLVP